MYGFAPARTGVMDGDLFHRHGIPAVNSLEPSRAGVSRGVLGFDNEEMGDFAEAQLGRRNPGGQFWRIVGVGRGQDAPAS